jgi:hypothetical protein
MSSSSGSFSFPFLYEFAGIGRTLDDAVDEMEHSDVI